MRPGISPESVLAEQTGSLQITEETKDSGTTEAQTTKVSSTSPTKGSGTPEAQSTKVTSSSPPVSAAKKVRIKITS